MEYQLNSSVPESLGSKTKRLLFAHTMEIKYEHSSYYSSMFTSNEAVVNEEILINSANKF